MSNYNSDRVFTDYVFTLAKSKIYPQLNWVEHQIDSDELEQLDIHHGIDSHIIDSEGKKHGIQYRFRDNYYSQYTDVTLRYKRDYNHNPNRIYSEFFKIEAKFLLYGITNGKKFSDKLKTNTDFTKWVVVDLDELKKAIDNGLIIIDKKQDSGKCKLIDTKMHCPINYNRDGSSSFVPFDIPMLKKISNNIVIQSYGFLISE